MQRRQAMSGLATTGSLSPTSAEQETFHELSEK